MSRICSVANNASDRVQEKDYNIAQDFGGFSMKILRDKTLSVQKLCRVVHISQKQIIWLLNSFQMWKKMQYVLLVLFI